MDKNSGEIEIDYYDPYGRNPGFEYWFAARWRAIRAKLTSGGRYE